MVAPPIEMLLLLMHPVSWLLMLLLLMLLWPSRRHWCGAPKRQHRPSMTAHLHSRVCAGS